MTHVHAKIEDSNGAHEACQVYANYMTILQVYNESNEKLYTGEDMNNTDLGHLRTTIDIAGQAREHGNHPFGAILVDDNNDVLLQAENTVVTGSDCTGHAETNLMRLATQHFSLEKLASCTLYTSTEPCAMCAGAIHWGNVRRVVYALGETDLYDMVGPSPDHLLLPCREVFSRSQRHVHVEGPALELRLEARRVHDGFWQV